MGALASLRGCALDTALVALPARRLKQIFERKNLYPIQRSVTPDESYVLPFAADQLMKLNWELLRHE